MSVGIWRVAVVGAGVMGQGIAQLAAQSGHMTWLFDVSPEAVDKARRDIAASLARRVARGKLLETESTQILARISRAEALEDLGDVDVVIEAVVEKLAVKHDLVQRLESICSADTLICSNTSSLSISGIAVNAVHPERLAGLHFFNPAPVMKLVEVVRGEHTGAEAIEQLTRFAHTLGKIPVTVQDSPGFIVNRCARPYYSEALVMLEQGRGDTRTIDACLTANAGMPLGPFELMDLIGLDVSLKATETIWRAFERHPRFAPSRVIRDKVAANELGRKSGTGFYAYPRTTSESRRRPKLSSAQALADWLTDQLGIPVVVSDGFRARERAAMEGFGCLLLDQSLIEWRDQDVTLAYSSAGLSADTGIEAERLALVQGIELKAVEDSPGLVVQRIVAMLYDEALRAVEAGVADADAIDTALCHGLNFQQGPFALARIVGDATIERIWRRLSESGPAGRYREP